MLTSFSWLTELTRRLKTSANLRRLRRPSRQRSFLASQLEQMEPRQLLSASPVGSEFLVNETITNHQVTTSTGQAGAVAMDSVGNYVIVWESNSSGNYDIYARQYNADGTAVSGEFQVNTYTPNDQEFATVAMDSTGDFVVTWTSYGPPGSPDGQDGSQAGVYARRYNAAGVAQSTEEFLVNTETTTSSQAYSSVAMNADGDFVVAWTSYFQDGPGNFNNYGIFAQRYDQDGVAMGGEIHVNTTTAGLQGTPTVAMDDAGDFVVAWVSGVERVFAQRYNAVGERQGEEFQVNNNTSAGQLRAPTVAMDAAGDFVVTWSIAGQEPSGQGYGVYAQRYNAAGVRQSDVFRVNTFTAYNQYISAIAMNSVGDFVVTWESEVQDSSGLGVFAQVYNADGTNNGPEFQVNTYVTENQFIPSVAMNPAGKFVIAWTSYLQDTSGFGVYAQRLDSSLANVLFDFGDAPDPTYSTLLASDGPRHVLGSGLFLGQRVDRELDGQPNATATGDDANIGLGGLPPPGGSVDDGGGGVPPPGGSVDDGGGGGVPPGGGLPPVDTVDEDGIVTTTDFIVGGSASIQVRASGSGFLDAWMDLNHNGVFDHPSEHLGGAESVPVVAGVNTLNFTIPTDAVPTSTYARLRLSSGGGLLPTGIAADGEVEDYQVNVVALDYGDAPDPTYPTLLANNGARHIIGTGLFLGVSVDSELDGQPNSYALGDDANIGTPAAPPAGEAPPAGQAQAGGEFPPPYSGGGDEDGVVSVSDFIVGQSASIQVLASGPGFLDAWMDLNNNGVFDHPSEHLGGGTSVAVVAGSNTLNFTIPSDAVPTVTYARLRLSSIGGLLPTGLAADGEVEDYRVQIVTFDFGDAPDPTYPTLLASDGARHIMGSGVFLGASVDSDVDGQPNATATGDDLNDDDEDGVTFTSPLIAGTMATVTVVAPTRSGKTKGMLDAWVDFDHNGTWSAGEQIFVRTELTGGSNLLSFPVPVGATYGVPTYARFRVSSNISSSDGLLPTGLAADGEVEDYQVSINAPAIVGSSAVLTPVVIGQAAASVTVATFTQGSNTETAGQFTATVDWGISGHNADLATVTQPGGPGTSYTVTSTRPVFSVAGNYTVKVSISHNSGTASTMVTDLLSVNTAEPVLRIIDDGDPGYSDTGFYVATNQGFQRDVHYTPMNNGKTATWNFGTQPAGTYRISATWYAYSNRATNAPYAINGTLVPGGINQKLAPSAFPNSFTDQGVSWADLNAAYVHAGGNLIVTLTSTGANNYVIADAVRIQTKATAPANTAPILATPSAINLTNTPAIDTFPVQTGTLTANDADVPAQALTYGISGGTLSGDTLTVSKVGTYGTLTVTRASGAYRYTPNAAAINALSTNASESFNVTVTDGSLTDTKGLAVYVTYVATPQTVMIIDDGTLGYSDTGFFVATNQGFQSDVHYTPANNGKTATWNFGTQPAGTYRISATWYAYSNRATNAPYAINGTLVPGGINQKLAPSTFPGSFMDQGASWANLNAAYVHAGGNLVVTLTSTGANNYVIADGVRVEFLHAEMAVPAAAGKTASESIAAADLVPFVAEASRRWTAIDPQASAALANVTVNVIPLPTGVLGLASDVTDEIWISPTAAGRGWFVDHTLQSDEEFGNAASPVAGIDLLTVVAHELGHLLGLPDLDNNGHPLDTMSESLASGVRHVPVASLP